MRPYAAWMGIIAMSMSGCASSAGFVETERTLCRELVRERPTYAVQDTPATKEQGVRFLTLLQALCEGTTS